MEVRGKTRGGRGVRAYVVAVGEGELGVGGVEARVADRKLPAAEVERLVQGVEVALDHQLFRHLD